MFSRIPKKVVAVGVLCVSVAFLLGVLRPFEDARLRVLAEQRERVEQSNVIYEDSRREYCGVFLSYYASCFSKKRDACAMLSSVTLEYADTYGGDPNADCAPDIVETEPEPEYIAEDTGELLEDSTPNEREQTDPMFFDHSLGQ